MQAQGSLLQGSMMSNFINIYQTEGTRGLWRVSAAFTLCGDVYVHYVCVDSGRFGYKQHTIMW